VSLQESLKFAQRLARQKKIDPEVAIQIAVDNALEDRPLDVSAEKHIRQELRNHLIGYGPLQEFLDDPEIEEIWVNGPNQVFFARLGKTYCLPLSIDQQDLRVIVERMLRSTGRRLDRSSPFVDASLADGSRLHVVIPEITRKFWSVNIRKFPNRIMELHDLLASRTITKNQFEYIVKALALNKNFLVSGATQAGKTTVLCALLNEVPDTQRLVSVEDTFEIRIQKPDWVGLQTRLPNLEGIGEVTLRRLV
jgi:pilus assembly protein CpaF